MPRLGHVTICGSFTELAEKVIQVKWQLADSSRFNLLANLGGRPISLTHPGPEPLYLSENIKISEEKLEMPPWSAAFFLNPG